MSMRQKTGRMLAIKRGDKRNQATPLHKK